MRAKHPKMGVTFVDPLEICFHGNQKVNIEFRFSNEIPNTEMSLYNLQVSNGG